MTCSLAFVKPGATSVLADSYRSLVSEFVDHGEKLIPFVLSFPHEDFAALVESLHACSHGTGPAQGWVAHTTFWLVRNDTELVGVSNLRHSLTPALEREDGNIGYSVKPSARRQGFGTRLLELTLREASQREMTELLLTCGKTNLASVRVILRNGGVLESEEFLPRRGEVVQRYRIRSIGHATADARSASH